MPKAARKPCSRHPRELLQNKQECPICHTQRRAKEREHRQKQGPRPYDTAMWKRIRVAQLSREPWCRHHMQDNEYVRATDVDHKDGDAWNMNADNLQSLCHECHSVKTAKENGSFGR